MRVLHGDPAVIWENNFLWVADEIITSILNKLHASGIELKSGYQIYFAWDGKSLGHRQHSRIGYTQLAFSGENAMCARLILG